jgi:hypothetical protein
MSRSVKLSCDDSVMTRPSRPVARTIRSTSSASLMPFCLMPSAPMAWQNCPLMSSE